MGVAMRASTMGENLTHKITARMGETNVLQISKVLSFNLRQRFASSPLLDLQIQIARMSRKLQFVAAKRVYILAPGTNPTLNSKFIS